MGICCQYFSGIKGNLMKPFFDKKDVKSDQITKIPLSCASCGLSKKAKVGRIKPWGKFGKRILIIGEAPTKKEDRARKPWQGGKGELIKDIFKQVGINLYQDALTTFAVTCPIPKDSKPEEKEVMCCRKNVKKIIKEYKPKLVFLVGAAAIQSVIGANWKKGLGGMERWRGWVIPDRNFDTWICPIFSPKYVETRDIYKKINLAEVVWLLDIKAGLAKLNTSIKYTDEKKYITYIESDKHFRSIYPRLMKADLMSFDYEGTGLKPHKKGHVITNTSACIGEKECYSWMNNGYRNKLFKRVLENPNVKKSAHNLSFENMWSLIILKAKVANWYWDTMVNAHILDNRKGVNGLKFQTYVNFGVSDYDSHVSPFLQSGDEFGANSFNDILRYIKNYGEKSILTYCGLDSIYGFGLTLLQMEMMKRG